MMFSFFLLAVVSSSSVPEFGGFDIDEIRNTLFDFKITQDYTWFSSINLWGINPWNVDKYEAQLRAEYPDFEPSSDYQFITNRHGQRYVCHIVPAVATESKLKKRNAKYYAKIIDEHFYMTGCVQSMRFGFWTYTLCRGINVTRIHQEYGYVNILGKVKGKVEIPEYRISTEERMFYLQESYVMGDTCHYDPSMRYMINVKYTCNHLLPENTFTIRDVYQDGCVFEMLAQSGSLCSIPPFQARTNTHYSPISCHPHMAKSEIRPYLELQAKLFIKNHKLEEEFKRCWKKLSEARRRFIGIYKTHEIFKDRHIRARVATEYKVANFDYLVAKRRLIDPSTMTEEVVDAIWDILNELGVMFDIFYYDYNGVYDEDRGNLWYYFHDRKWEWKLFPKSVLIVTIENHYYIDFMQHIRDQVRNNPFVFKGIREKFERLCKYGAFNAQQFTIYRTEGVFTHFSDNLMANFSFGTEIANYFQKENKKVYLRHRSAQYNSNQLIENFLENPYLLSLLKKMFSTIDDDIEIMKRNGLRALTHREKFMYIVLEEEKKSPSRYNYKIDTTKFIALERRIMRVISPLYCYFIAYHAQDMEAKYYFTFPTLSEIINGTSKVQFKIYKEFGNELINMTRIATNAVKWKLKRELRYINNEERKGTYSISKFLKYFKNTYKRNEKPITLKQTLNALSVIMNNSTLKALDESKYVAWTWVMSYYTLGTMAFEQSKRLASKANYNSIEDNPSGTGFTKNDAEPLAFDIIGYLDIAYDEILFFNDFFVRVMNDATSNELRERFDQFYQRQSFKGIKVNRKLTVEKIKRVLALVKKIGLKEHLQFRQQMVDYGRMRGPLTQKEELDVLEVAEILQLEIDDALPIHKSRIEEAYELKQLF